MLNYKAIVEIIGSQNKKKKQQMEFIIEDFVGISILNNRFW